VNPSRCITKTFGVNVSGHFIWIILFGGLVIAFAAFFQLSTGSGHGGLEPLGDNLHLVHHGVLQPGTRGRGIRSDFCRPGCSYLNEFFTFSFPSIATADGYRWICEIALLTSKILLDGMSYDNQISTARLRFSLEMLPA
jgi:hypothetical protein